MERIDLFPTSIYKTRIGPTLWNKDQFVNQSIQSYNIDPHRHAKNMPASEFHTTFRDWNNEKFNKIDCSVLSDVYKKVVDEFFIKLKLRRTTEYKWNIVNVSVGKDNWYDMHYHGGYLDKDNFRIEYVMVHYVKFDKEVHRSTTFKNPLIHSIYDYQMIFSSKLDFSQLENSSYFSLYELDTNEDDVVIFPSYLFHGVFKKNSNTEKFRIITSTHIDVKYTDNELYASV